MSRVTHDHDDMTTLTTPTTKGWRSDVSIILLGWSVTLVGLGQYPRFTSYVKDGRSWAAQRLTKPSSTTGARQEHDPQQNFLITFPHFKLFFHLFPLPCAFESQPRLRASLPQPLCQPLGGVITGVQEGHFPNELGLLKIGCTLGTFEPQEILRPVRGREAAS